MYNQSLPQVAPAVQAVIRGNRDRYAHIPATTPNPPPTLEETLRRKATNLSLSRAEEADRMIEANSHLVHWHSRDLTRFRIHPRHNAPKGPPYLVNLVTVTCTCPDCVTLKRVNTQLVAIGDCGSLYCKHISYAWRLANELVNLIRAMMPTQELERGNACSECGGIAPSAPARLCASCRCDAEDVIAEEAADGQDTAPFSFYDCFTTPQEYQA